jgi:hypothetical protein
VSSSYYAYCLSHDPALTISSELTFAEAKALDDRDGLVGHEQCDIAVGRVSGALIEVGCLGLQLPGPTGCKGHHARIDWASKEWLRLLAAGAPHVDADLIAPLTTRGCWPLDRLTRLRVELGLPAPTTKEN